MILAITRPLPYGAKDQKSLEKHEGLGHRCRTPTLIQSSCRQSSTVLLACAALGVPFFTHPVLTWHLIEGAKRATVKTMDTRAILRIDIGFYMGITPGAFYGPCIGFMSFWRTNNIDSSSYRG